MKKMREIKHKKIYQYNYYSERDIDEINKSRIAVGLRPIVQKYRKCLKCDKEFLSLGLGHRTCGCTGGSGVIQD